MDNNCQKCGKIISKYLKYCNLIDCMSSVNTDICIVYNCYEHRARTNNQWNAMCEVHHSNYQNQKYKISNYLSWISQGMPIP